MGNAFGVVVDDAMLDKMERYANKPKTQEDRAREAMRLINDEGKDVIARNYVQKLKDRYGNGVATLGLVYNGTGNRIRYEAAHDWHGHIGDESPYPTEIGNGQWGAFLHVHSSGAAVGSTATVVYRGQNRNGDYRDFLLAWDVPWGFGRNKAYCDVGAVNSFQSRWGEVEDTLSNRHGQYKTDTEESHVEVDIGSGTSPNFVAKLSIHYRG